MRTLLNVARGPSVYVKRDTEPRVRRPPAVKEERCDARRSDTNHNPASRRM